MAFPVVQATNTSVNNTAGTTHTVNLPASIASGDLLIIIFVDSDGTGNTNTFPSGWNLLTKDNSTTAIGLQIAWRIADGTEGATISVTTTATTKTAHNSYRINTWDGAAAPEKAAPGTATGTALNPSATTPSWGSADTLWIEVGAHGNTPTFTAASTNYTNLLSAASTGGAGGNNAGAGSARRNLTASSEDPDNTFTISASTVWLAQTLAVKPAAAADTLFGQAVM